MCYMICLTDSFGYIDAFYTTKHHIIPQLIKYGEIVRDLAQRQANWVFMTHNSLLSGVL